MRGCLLCALLGASFAFGQASFTRSDITIGTGPQRVAVADFNGDHIPDLAVLNSTGAVSIVIGNGDLTCLTPKTTTIGDPPTFADVAAGDFNGDGEPGLGTPAKNLVSIALCNVRKSDRKKRYCQYYFPK